MVFKVGDLVEVDNNIINYLLKNKIVSHNLAIILEVKDPLPQSTIPFYRVALGGIQDLLLSQLYLSRVRIK